MRLQIKVSRCQLRLHNKKFILYLCGTVMYKGLEGCNICFPWLFNSFMTEVTNVETSPLICRANQWTGFYMIGTSIMKELTDTSVLPLALFLLYFYYHSN